MWAVLLFAVFFGGTPVALAQNAPVLVLSTADTEPFVRRDGSGFYQLLMEEAGRRAGVQVDIRMLPSERSLQDAIHGRVDGEFGRIAAIAQQYPALQIVPEPLVDWQFSAFVRTGDAPPQSFADLRGRHVGFIRGWRIYEENVRGAQSVTRAVSEDQLFSLLQSNRVDVILYNNLRGLSWIERNGATGISLVAPPLESRGMHLYLHESRGMFVRPLADALRAIKEDGTYAHLQVEAFGFLP